MGWKVVIADDEAPAREELVYLVEQMPDVEHIGEAAGGMEAIKKVKELAPDILFLDMDMPDITGMQVAEIIGQTHPQLSIVFSTAYDHYAVDAFKVRAFHYMVKPYDTEDVSFVFRELLKKRELLGPQQSAAPKPRATSGKLALEIGEGIKYVDPKDIVYISKEGKHVQIHLPEHAYGVSYTLLELEQKLEPFGFYRCHKSYLVNLASIGELKSWVNGAYNLLMDDVRRSSIPVSRNYIKELRLKLEI